MASVNDTTEMSSTADVLGLAQEIIEVFAPFISDEVPKEVCEVVIFESVYVDISKFSTFIGVEVHSCWDSFNQGK